MIRWITDNLGTAPYCEAKDLPEVLIVDVRSLVDKPGNTPSMIRQKLQIAVDGLQAGRRVVVCCDFGISRSNAIAAGILAVTSGQPLGRTVRTVTEATGEKSIRLEVLSAVRAAVEKSTVVSVREQPGDRRVLVTGGTGFVGSALRPRLQGSFDVAAPSRQQSDVLQCALELDNHVKQHRITDLILLAEPRAANTNKAFGEGLCMLRNVLDVCRENSLRLLHVSGVEVFAGYLADKVLADETIEPRPAGLMGQYKHLCETLIADFRRQHGLKCCTIRTPRLYGGNGLKPRFLARFIEKAGKNEYITTHEYQNGPPVLDLLHLDDFCLAIEAMLRCESLTTIHLGGADYITTAKLAEATVELARSGSKIGRNVLEAHHTNIRLDSTKAREELGWEPKVRIEQWLERILNSKHPPR